MGYNEVEFLVGRQELNQHREGLTSKTHLRPVRTPGCPKGAGAPGRPEGQWGRGPLERTGTLLAGKPVVACCLHCRLYFGAGLGHLKAVFFYEIVTFCLNVS